MLTVVPLFLILGYIAYKGAGQVTGAFFTNLPNDNPPGLYHALVGSVTLVGLAAAFAIPVGLARGDSPERVPATAGWSAPVRFVAELLGGVPSIVIGVFGYAILVYPFWLEPGERGWGFSAWAGAFALGVMMLPVVIRSAEEAMRLVPNSLREASYALGASRRQTVLKVVIPAALPAIITGVLLAVGRIAGETAPLDPDRARVAVPRRVAVRPDRRRCRSTSTISRRSRTRRGRTWPGPRRSCWS